MRLWSLLLVCLLVVSAQAGEETTPKPAPAVTPAPATEAAPAATSTPTVEKAAGTAADHTEFRLANALMQVDVIDWQGAIRRVSLLGSHPVRLHPWQVKAKEDLQQKVLDPSQPLPVLDVFKAVGSNHNWISGIGLDDVKSKWRKVSGDNSHLVLGYEDLGKGLRWTLRYDLPADSLALRSTLTIENIGQADNTLRPVIYPLNGVHQDDVKQDATYLALVHHNGGANGTMTSLYQPALPTPGQLPIPTIIPTERLDYVCLKSRFFAAIWHPLSHGVKDATNTATTQASSSKPAAPSEGGPNAVAGGPGGPQPTMATSIGAMNVKAYGYTDIYGGHQTYVEAQLLGPNGAEVVLKPMQKFEAVWTISAASMTKRDRELLGETVGMVEYSSDYYKFFRSLVWPLTFLLDWLVKLVQNYGVAVVVLTFLIKLALHRTTFKQHESMMKMQKLAPDLKLLQEQYKNDKQKLAMKQMELWKKHGVNPLGGCLPILIQIPIFTALYLAFCHSADMRGAGFLWINDLTLPDQLIGWVISGWHVSINPLPIIYIGVSIWMSMMQKAPPGADPQQEQMMKMMRWMPVLFGVIFYNFPSGLVLYFTINAVLSTIEIKMVRKKLGMH